MDFVNSGRKRARVASGIYLWAAFGRERLAGTVAIGLGPLVALFFVIGPALI